MDAEQPAHKYSGPTNSCPFSLTHNLLSAACTASSSPNPTHSSNLRDGYQHRHHRRIVQERRQEEGEAHEAEQARGKTGPQPEDVLGGSVGKPGTFDTLDYHEQGAHGEDARVVESRQRLLRGNHAGVPYQGQGEEDLWGGDPDQQRRPWDEEKKNHRVELTVVF